MKKFNIPKIKFPKMDEKTKDKVIDGAKTTAKILLGLFALGVCLKGCYSCADRSYQRMKIQEALDKKTPATLIDKRITPAYHRGGESIVTLYCDTDGNPLTAEAMFATESIVPAKVLPFYNLTNGTKKTIAEWKKMAPMAGSVYSD